MLNEQSHDMIVVTHLDQAAFVYFKADVDKGVRIDR